MSTKRTRKTEEELANGVKRLKVQEKAKPAAKKAEARSATKKAEARSATKKAEAKPAAKKAEAKTPVVKKAGEPLPFLKSRTVAVHELAQRPGQSGAVLVFGNGDCGQLGLGEDMIERKKPFPVGALAGETVVDVTCGGLHTIAMTASGVLWSWGCNDQQALGRSGDEFEAAPVEGLDGIRVVRVACSDSATFALTDGGRVYAWGTFRSSEGIMGFSDGVSVQARPALVAAFREPIVDLCAGVDHALALAASGRVYAWGYGQQGQLGRLVLERRRLHGLNPERLRLHDVRAIGCGSYHSFAVTGAGIVYAWGLNNFRQLGLADDDGAAEEVVHEPTPIRGLAGADIVRIAGGEHHSLALAKDGHLFAFGRSDSHQTGLPFATLPTDNLTEEDSHKKAISAPTLISSVSKIAFADFACGSNHNIALANDGRAYTWGYGEMLQLGNAEEKDVAEPLLLEGQKIDGKRILKVAAGGQHSVILAQ